MMDFEKSTYGKSVRARRLKKLKHKNAEPDVLEPVDLDRGEPLPCTYSLCDDSNPPYQTIEIKSKEKLPLQSKK